MPRGGGAKRSKSLRGYTRVSKNRWRTRAGKEITDYEYRNRIAKAQGWSSASQADRFRKTQTWRSWVLDATQTRKNYDDEGRYIGPDLSYRGTLIRDAYLVRQREQADEPLVLGGARQPMDETELGRLLIATGRRPQDAYWEYV